MAARSKNLFKNVVALILLAGLALHVDLRLLWRDALANLSVSSVAALLAISLILVYLSVLKWWLFLQRLGTSQSVWRLYGLYLVGYFVNLVVPSYVGGDAVRSFYAGQRSGQHSAAAATILERYTGFVAMVVMGLLALPFVSQATTEIRWALVGVAALVAGGTAVVLSRRISRLIAFVPYLSKAISHLQRVQEALRFGLTEPRLVLRAFALSLIYHSMTILNTAVAAWAVGWGECPVRELFAVVPLILLIGSLPITPGGLGIQEGAFLFFLKALGASEAEALGVGVVLRAKTYLLAVCGGLIWLRLGDRSVSEMQARQGSRQSS